MDPAIVVSSIQDILPSSYRYSSCSKWDILHTWYLFPSLIFVLDKGIIDLLQISLSIPSNYDLCSSKLSFFFLSFFSLNIAVHWVLNFFSFNICVLNFLHQTSTIKSVFNRKHVYTVLLNDAGCRSEVFQIRLVTLFLLAVLKVWLNGQWYPEQDKCSTTCQQFNEIIGWFEKKSICQFIWLKVLRKRLDATEHF